MKQTLPPNRWRVHVPLNLVLGDVAYQGRRNGFLFPIPTRSTEERGPPNLGRVLGGEAHRVCVDAMLPGLLLQPVAPRFVSRTRGDGGGKRFGPQFYGSRRDASLGHFEREAQAPEESAA